MRTRIGPVCLAVVVTLNAAGCSSLVDLVDTLQQKLSESQSASAPPASDDSTEDTHQRESGTPCSSVAPSATNAAEPEAEEVARSFAGCWQSNQWDWMRIESNGTTVMGTCEHDDGRIKAMVSGAVLLGTWPEAPSYAPSNDAGRFEFTLSADGQSFTGHWKYGSDGGWEGLWTAVRVECEPVATTNTHGPWADSWETSFGEMALQFSGDQVAGTYAHDSGRIQGIVSERVIVGTWAESPSYAPPHYAG